MDEDLIYKYFVFTTAGTVVWESGYNRSLPKGETPLIDVFDDHRSQAVPGAFILL